MIEQMLHGLPWDQTRVSVVKIQRLVGEIPVVVVLHDRTNAAWTVVGSNPGLCSEKYRDWPTKIQQDKNICHNIIYSFYMPLHTEVSILSFQP